jgi:hypothetical protein
LRERERNNNNKNVACRPAFVEKEDTDQKRACILSLYFLFFGKGEVRILVQV